jgi:hypothetical protein
LCFGALKSIPTVRYFFYLVDLEPPRAKAGAPPMVSPVDPEPPTEARVAEQVVVYSVAMLTGDPASKVAKVP